MISEIFSASMPGGEGGHDYTVYQEEEGDLVRTFNGLGEMLKVEKILAEDDGVITRTEPVSDQVLREERIKLELRRGTDTDPTPKIKKAQLNQVR